ncbi:MAG: hypothetical protein IJV73_01300 [Clostridia bacterium]|nr:hypothetical protein [Clostridia bacterium]
MLETKTLTVNPNAEQSTIDLFASFGWGLKSSQEIKNKDSHLERRGDEIVNVTESEHYIKLVFERDTKRENYDKLKELENTYFDIMAQEPVPENVQISIPIAAILLVMYVVPGVVYIILRIKKRKKAAAEYQTAYTAWKEKEKIAIAALKEAKELA